MSDIDLPVVYYRRGHWYMKLAERKRRSARYGYSRRYCQRQAALCFQMAGLGAQYFPTEGRYMADSG